jgi:hypothetical protein
MDHGVNVHRVAANDVLQLEDGDRLTVPLTRPGEAVMMDPSRGKIDFSRIDIIDAEGDLTRADAHLAQLAESGNVEVEQLWSSEVVFATEVSDAETVMEMPIDEREDPLDYESRKACVGEGCCGGFCCNAWYCDCAVVCACYCTVTGCCSAE